MQSLPVIDVIVRLTQKNPTATFKVTAEFFLCGSQRVSRVLSLLRGDDHLSGTGVTDGLMRPYPGTERAAPLFPYLVLLQEGFAGPASYLTAGELLPRLSTLTYSEISLTTDLRYRRYISVALSLGSPPPGITRHLALWSSDFPQRLPFGTCPRDHLVDFVTILLDYISSVNRIEI